MTKQQEENLQALQNVAKETAEFMGHSMSKWCTLLSNAANSSESMCLFNKCLQEAKVTFDSQGMHITGRAIFTVCKSEDDHAPQFPFRTS